MADDLEEIERKTREQCRLSAEDVELYRTLLRAEPNPAAPPMTATQHREVADEIDQLEKIFLEEKNP